MASPKQLAANRANAKKSTGPRTPKGKAVSRFNALKFGITAQSLLLPHESIDAFDALSAEYAGRFRPQSPEQRFLVKTLVTADWFTDRLNRAEPDVWKHDFATRIEFGDDVQRGGASIVQHHSFQHYSRLRRCHATLHRTYLATMKELRAEGIKTVDPEPGPGTELGLFCTSPQPDPNAPAGAQADPHSIRLVPREQMRKVLREVIREAMHLDLDGEPMPPETLEEAPSLSGDGSPACSPPDAPENAGIEPRPSGSGVFAPKSPLIFPRLPPRPTTLRPILVASHRPANNPAGISW